MTGYPTHDLAAEEDIGCKPLVLFNFKVLVTLLMGRKSPRMYSEKCCCCVKIAIAIAVMLTKIARKVLMRLEEQIFMEAKVSNGNCLKVGERAVIICPGLCAIDERHLSSSLI